MLFYLRVMTKLLSNSAIHNNYSRRQAYDSGFQPQQQPVVALPQGQHLQEEALQLDFIRAAFQQPLQWELEALYTDLHRDPLATTKPFSRAAVFMALVQRPSGVNIIFTRRADHLFNHAGEICFPGGRAEESDKDEIATALRETQEEIGIAADYVALMGTHPGFVTTSRFLMTPVIGEVKAGFTITPDPSEVAEVFEVPLEVLMDPSQHRLHQASFQGKMHRYFTIVWQSRVIWGATAGLVRNFYRFLSAAQKEMLS